MPRQRIARMAVIFGTADDPAVRGKVAIVGPGGVAKSTWTKRDFEAHRETAVQFFLGAFLFSNPSAPAL
jgi:hypothetical protein